MLHVFLNCGLRLSELKNLKIDDIDFKENKFTIIGKGNKERINYLNKKTKDALEKYLKIRDKFKNKKIRNIQARTLKTAGASRDTKIVPNIGVIKKSLLLFVQNFDAATVLNKNNQ